jgi:hypothetical protein
VGEQQQGGIGWSPDYKSEPRPLVPPKPKEPTMPDNTPPRRIQMEKWVPAEKAIREAVLAVEAMPADVRLTDAVVLLQAAKDSVADFVDGIDKRRIVTTAMPDTDLVSRGALREQFAQNRSQYDDWGGQSWNRCMEVVNGLLDAAPAVDCAACIFYENCHAYKGMTVDFYARGLRTLRRPHRRRAR